MVKGALDGKTHDGPPTVAPKKKKPISEPSSDRLKAKDFSCVSHMLVQLSLSAAESSEVLGV